MLLALDQCGMALNTHAAAARELMAEDPAVVAQRTSLHYIERHLWIALVVFRWDGRSSAGGDTRKTRGTV